MDEAVRLGQQPVRGELVYPGERADRAIVLARTPEPALEERTVAAKEERLVDVIRERSVEADQCSAEPARHACKLALPEWHPVHVLEDEIGPRHPEQARGPRTGGLQDMPIGLSRRGSRTKAGRSGGRRASSFTTAMSVRPSANST